MKVTSWYNNKINRSGRYAELETGLLNCLRMSAH